MKPRLVVALPNYSVDDPGSWQHLLDRARAADAAGVDRLVVFDHVVFGERLEEYGRPEVGGQAGGRQPTGPDGHWLEPLTLLSVIAGITNRIKLSTGILIAALRRPIVLAKQAATLDVLSDGRLELGVGVGWQREEYDAAGLDFDGRGRLLDEALEICQQVWRTTDAAFTVGDRRVEHIHQMPKPRQPGGVPLWISGTLNRRVIDRIVRFGAGWIPWGADADEPATGLARLRTALADAGRRDDRLGAVTNLRLYTDGDAVDLDRTMDPVPRLVAAGITDFQVRATDGFDELVAAFRSAT